MLQSGQKKRHFGRKKAQINDIGRIFPASGLQWRNGHGNIEIIP